MNDFDFSQKIIGGESKEACLDYLKKRYKEQYGIENVEVIDNELKNEYVFKYNDIELGRVSKDKTIHDAEILLDKQLSETTIEMLNENEDYNKPKYYHPGKRKKSQNINLDINERDFDEVIQIIGEAEKNNNVVTPSDIDSVENELTGDLKKEYSNGSQTIKKSTVCELQSLLEEYKLKVKYSFEMVKDKDKSLYPMLANIIEQVFSLGKTTEYGVKSSDEKKKNIEEELKNTKDLLEYVEQRIKEHGTNLGVVLNKDICNAMFSFLDALGITNSETILTNGSVDWDGITLYGYDPKTIFEVLQADEKYDIFNNIDAYLDGKSFKDTLLSIYLDNQVNARNFVKETLNGKLYGGITSDYEDVEDKIKKANELKKEQLGIIKNNDEVVSKLESNFLFDFLKSARDNVDTIDISWDSSSDKSNYLKRVYSDLDNPWADFMNSDEKQAVKEIMSDINYADFKSITKKAYNEYITDMSDLVGLNAYQKELNKELNRISLFEDADNPNYWKYLTREYNDSDIDKIINKMKENDVESSLCNVIKYCSQDEIALLYYYLFDSDFDRYYTKTWSSNDYKGRINWTLGTDAGLPLDTFEWSNSKQVRVGSDKAKELLNSLWDTLNIRAGFQEACDTISRGGADVFEGLSDGIIKYVGDVDNFIRTYSSFVWGNNYVIGNHPASNDVSIIKPTSVVSYKSAFLMQLFEMAKKPKGERGEYEEILKNVDQLQGYTNKFSYTVSNQLGNMVLPILLGSAYGGAFGAGLVGLGAAGNSAGYAKSRGLTDTLKIMEYSTLNGLSEATLTYLLSRIPGVGKAFKEGKTFFSKCLGEAKEEFLQAYIESGLNSCYFGDAYDHGETTLEAFNGAFYGFIISGIANGASSLNYTYKGIKYTVNPQQALADLAKHDGDVHSYFETMKEKASESVERPSIKEKIGEDTSPVIETAEGTLGFDDIETTPNLTAEELAVEAYMKEHSGVSEKTAKDTVKAARLKAVSEYMKLHSDVDLKTAEAKVDEMYREKSTTYMDQFSMYSEELSKKSAPTAKEQAIEAYKKENPLVSDNYAKRMVEANRTRAVNEYMKLHPEVDIEGAQAKVDEMYGKKTYREQYEEYKRIRTSIEEAGKTGINAETGEDTSPVIEPAEGTIGEADTGTSTETIVEKVVSEGKKSWIPTNFLPYVVGPVLAVATIIGLILNGNSPDDPVITPSSSPIVTPEVKTSSSPVITPSSSPTITPGATASSSPGIAESSSPTISPSATASSGPGIAASSSPTITPGSTVSSSPVVTPKNTQSGSNGNKFLIKDIYSLPKKYKLSNNSRNSLLNIISNYLKDKNKNSITAIGMNIIVDGTRYNDLFTCDSNSIGKEASLVSINEGREISTYHDSTCYRYHGVFYATNVGSLTIANVTSKSEYNKVISDRPNDTFVYDKILMQNGLSMNSGNNTTLNVGLCSTGSGYKVFVPNSSVTENEYNNVLSKNGCIDAVLLPGNEYFEYRNNRIIKSIIHGGQTFDSIMYFE